MSRTFIYTNPLHTILIKCNQPTNSCNKQEKREINKYFIEMETTPKK